MLHIFKSTINNIFDIKTINLPVYKKFLYKSLQVMLATIRDIADGQISLRAMSLVYTTLITLVPLLALSFSVLKGFGVHKEIESTLLAMLEPLGPDKSIEITSHVISFVDNIQVGVLGTVGLALLIYAVISLMQKIEKSFNYIWRVAENRSLAKRFADYLTVLLVGPLLIFISAGITTTIHHSEFVQAVESTISFPLLYDIMEVAIPWIIMSLGFAFIFMFMPNTKVKVRYALIGGLFAAFAWKFMGWVFFMFIAGSASYVAIYAAFATLILLMIWLYLGWLVILIGANISFYLQNSGYIKISRGELIISPRMQKIIAIGIISNISKSYYNNEKSNGAEELSIKLNMPILAVQNMVNILEIEGFVISDRNDPPRYFPAKSFGETKLSELIDKVESHGEDNIINNKQILLPDNSSALKENLYNKYSEISNKRLKDLY